jgi:ATP/ADP translocase
MVTAAMMIAHQVGGKATRDALFLSTFDVTSLPEMFIGASLFSFAMVLLFSRLLSRFGPARIVPIAFGASGLLLFGEWTLVSAYPKLGSIVVYLHMAGLGSVLISGFWSVVSEQFDPRAAKRQIGRIAAGATFGGVLGGLLAERVADSLSVAAMLPVLGILHLFCAWRVQGVEMPRTSRVSPTDQGGGSTGLGPEPSGWEILRKAPYLRNLAVLTILTAVSDICLDYVFKARADQVYGQGEDLMRFFAILYAAVAVGTFFFQTTLSRHALERFGLARTVGALPLVVLAGAVGAAAVPGLASITIAWALAAAIGDSLFRSGYEILYTPIPPREKRATKSLIDVGCKRLGDLLGGGIIWLVIQLGPVIAIPSVLGVAILLAIVGIWFIRQLNRGYVVSLERALLNRAVELDLSDVQDGTTRSTLLRTLHKRPGASLQAAFSPAQAGAGPPAYKGASPLQSIDAPAAALTAESQQAAAILADPVLRKIAGLRSGNAQTVRQILGEDSSLDLILVPHVIVLLARDEMVPEAVTALRKAGPRITGQLVDVLLDPEQPFAVRRRLPRVLSACASQRAADGLFAALADKRFEVRYQCGSALTAVTEQNPDIHIAPEMVYDAVHREVTAGTKVWEAHQLLDRTEDQYGPAFAGLLRDRTSRSMDHVFRLLSLVLPKEPLQIAFRGLHAGDKNLRGIALEYLESVLPPSVREPLWPYLEDHRPAKRQTRSQEEALATLIGSHESIELDLAASKKRGSEPIEF